MVSAFDFQAESSGSNPGCRTICHVCMNKKKFGQGNLECGYPNYLTLEVYENNPPLIDF